MTSAFSWQNSISLCPASFFTPTPNLPVTPGISGLPTCAFQSPIMKRTSFVDVISRGSYRSSYNHSTSAFQCYWSGNGLRLLWYWIICLPWKRTEIILLFLRLYPDTVLQTFLLTMINVLLNTGVFKCTWIMVIQVYAPTSNAEEAEVKQFYEDLQDLLEITPKKLSFSSLGIRMQK